MAQEGVLGRTSCRSWVSWACWGGPRAVESRTNPPAGWLAGCRGLPGGVLGVTGHGKVLLPWMGFLPFWAVGGVLTANLHLFLSQHRGDAADQYGARGPEAPPRIT